jgi:hypothetical protein
MKSLNCLDLAVIAACLVPAAAEAQSVPTNLPGVRAYLNAPADFNPVPAAPEALDVYGFPPRPNATSAPEDYADWVRTVTTPARAILPILKETNIYHGPARNLRGAGAGTVGNVTDVTSSNWSGYIISSSTKPFKVEEVKANFMVPVAQQAFGICSESAVYGSSWVGIDGDGSDDVLQDGISFSASCDDSVTTPSYAAWYEWYPYSETVITNFPVSPGDDITVEVWNTSATAAKAYLINYTANTKVTISFSAPSGTTLTGNCVEWIVERPEVGDGLTNLTNYIATAFFNSMAWNYTASTPTYNEPGKAPSGTVYASTMLDNSSNPISYPVVGGTVDIWFFDEGSAR